jgi:hypothetical protein
LSCHFQISEPFMEPIKTPDAVVHFAGTFDTTQDKRRSKREN